MKKIKRPISVMLIAVMLVFFSPTDSRSDDTQKACGAPCVLGIAIMVVGAIFYLALRDFCKRHLPPPQPDPPPKNNRTNSLAIYAPSQASVLLLSDEAVELIEITTNGWHDPWGNIYAISFNTVLEQSDDMLIWDFRYAITGYVSFAEISGGPNWFAPSNTCCVLFDDHGTAIKTNWSWDSESYQIEPTSEKRFYRLSHD